MVDRAPPAVPPPEAGALPERMFLGLPAPAKLNLFLHVTGRRADGYHDLQTVFIPIDLADRIDLVARSDGQIERTGDLIGALQGDLALRAARALQRAAWPAGDGPGASIRVVKCIPAGSGMGGGSSDAATTLIGLNRLWRLHWPRERLAPLARALGADVPFFLQPGPALGEGIGDRLTPAPLPGPLHALVVHPQVHVSTEEIFNDPALTRIPKHTTIAGFSVGAESLAWPGAGSAGQMRAYELYGSNDLEPVVRGRAPEVDRAAVALARSAGAARLTGSGSALFALFGERAGAEQAAAALAVALGSAWKGSVWAVPVLAEHPLAPW